MERFIIGTGRCGSTLMSVLMGENEDILSLSEYNIACQPEQGWPNQGTIDGAEFSRMYSRWDGPIALYFSRDLRVPEILNDTEGVQSAPKQLSIVPTCMLSALPFLSDDPELLHQELLAQAKSQPPQTLRDHFLQMNLWLQHKFNKKCWVERSGLSTNTFGKIHQTFPDAQYLHIYRDGPECALSMREHVDVLLRVSYHFDPPSDEELSRSLDLSLPRDEDPVLQRIANPPSVEQFGEFWSYCIERFYAHVHKVNPGQLLTISYENLVNDPETTLNSVAAHFDLPSDLNWIDKARAKIRAPLRTRADKLPPEQQARLEKACEPGRILLGIAKQQESPYIDSSLKLQEIIRAAGIA